MDSKEKFINFLESIKTDSTSQLIDNVVKGFNVCYENGHRGVDLGMAPSTAIGHVASNIPTSKAPDDEKPEIKVPESENSETEVVELPDPSEETPEVKEALTDDITKFVAFLKEDPKNMEVLQKLMDTLK